MTAPTDTQNEFASHVATYQSADMGGATVEWLKWKNPENGFYRVDYMCLGGTVLCVSGDIGEAVYNSGGKSMEWWTKCDVGYFASKCYASESGRGYKAWDDAIARQRVIDEVASRRNDEYEIDEDLVEEAIRAIEGGRHEWDEWMRSDECRSVFGDDWWDYVPNFGVIVAPRCALHLAGLKMAFAQLQAASA